MYYALFLCVVIVLYTRKIESYITNPRPAAALYISNLIRKNMNDLNTVHVIIIISDGIVVVIIIVVIKTDMENNLCALYLRYYP